MKTIISGTRGFGGITHRNHLENAIEICDWPITEVFHGACMDSPDYLGELWASENGVPFRRFKLEPKEDLRELGIPFQAAGPRRNRRMIKAGAEALIALWDGASPGTHDMIEAMKKRNAPILVYYLNGRSPERFPKQVPLFTV